MSKKDAGAGQSPVVRELIREVGVHAVVREDGSVTVSTFSNGVKAKVITAFPLQWRELFRHADELLNVIDPII